MNKLPTIKQDKVDEQNQDMKQRIVSGNVANWMNETLKFLHDNNPILYKYITERANKFAMGAVMVGDPQSIAMSQALEQILLLDIVNTHMISEEERQKFEQLLGENWLGKIEGLDNFGDKGEADKGKGK